MAKIIVFGARGMLGSYVVKYLSQNHTVTSITRQEYNILTDSIPKLNNLIKNHDVVINCAGIIPQTNNVDAQEYFKVNTHFPLNLGEICTKLKIKLIHITTDCVYNGKTYHGSLLKEGEITKTQKSPTDPQIEHNDSEFYEYKNGNFIYFRTLKRETQPNISEREMKKIYLSTTSIFNKYKYYNTIGRYSESAFNDEPSEYGISKAMGEVKDHCVIRTSIVGEEIYNKRSLLEWVKSKKPEEKTFGYVNHYWNGITCLQLAKIIGTIIEKKLYWVGTKHVFSPNIVSKYELVSLINDVYELGLNIVPYVHKQTTDKTLKTNFEKLFNIPNLVDQIAEQKLFSL